MAWPRAASTQLASLRGDATSAAVSAVLARPSRPSATARSCLSLYVRSRSAHVSILSTSLRFSSVTACPSSRKSMTRSVTVCTHFWYASRAKSIAVPMPGRSPAVRASDEHEAVSHKLVRMKRGVRQWLGRLAVHEPIRRHRVQDVYSAHRRRPEADELALVVSEAEHGVSVAPSATG